MTIKTVVHTIQQGLYRICIRFIFKIKCSQYMCFCHSRNKYLDASLVGKFDSIYDIQYHTYRKIFVKAENKIITGLIIDQLTKQNPLRVVEFLKKLQSQQESSGSKSSENSMSLPLAWITQLTSYIDGIMGLPQELFDQIISYCDLNDFRSLIDFAESEESEEVAAWARSVLTAR